MRKSSVAKYLHSEPYYKDKLSLSEQLALDRTILANERTFLSYMRTSLTIFVVGISFIELLDSPIIEIIGVIFLPIALSIFILGVKIYLKIRKELYNMREKIESNDANTAESVMEKISIEK